MFEAELSPMHVYCLYLEQWVSTFPTLLPFPTVSHAVVTPNPKIIFIAISEL